MILTTTASLIPGMTLSKPVYNDLGKVLIGRDIPVTDRMIFRLKQLGISYVYINDGRTEDIIPSSSISEKTRMNAFKTLKKTFDQLHSSELDTSSPIYELIDGNFTPMITNIISDMKFNNDAISLLSDVFSFDDHIYTHSLDVAIYSLAVGMGMGLKERQLIELGLGAILHDIGKVKLPLSILQKKARLTDEEYKLVQKHPEYGFNILRKASNISLLTAHCAYQHHERIDGSGYPRGLKQNDIHFYSKVIAVCDVFDAVTTNRVYRKAMLPHEGLEILFSGAGQQFDLDMVNVFHQSVSIYPNGMMVNLSDGRSGVVVKQNKGMNSRPVIRILQEKDRDINPYEVDLSEELNIVITGCDTKIMDVIAK